MHIASKFQSRLEDITFYLTRSRSSQLPTTGFFCTAYKSFFAGLANGTIFTTRSRFILLSTPFYVVLATTSLERPSLPLSAFTSSFKFPYCRFNSLATGTIGTSLGPNFPIGLTRALIPPQPTATTYSSPTSQLTPTPQPTATICSSSTSQLRLTKSSPSQYTQSASASPGETIKLIIGLVVTITVFILLVTIGLTSCYVIRKRRRRKNTCIATHHAASETINETQCSQMYIGLKVELDVGQRKHEMETTDTRYELEGSGVIREIAAGTMEFLSGNQELSGDKHPEGLDKPS